MAVAGAGGAAPGSELEAVLSAGPVFSSAGDAVVALAALREKAVDPGYRAAHYSPDAIAGVSAKIVTAMAAYPDLINVQHVGLQLANTVTLAPGGSEALAAADMFARLVHVFHTCMETAVVIMDCAIICKNVLIQEGLRDAGHVLVAPLVRAVVHWHQSDTLAVPFSPTLHLLAALKNSEDNNLANRALVRDAWLDALDTQCFTGGPAALACDYLLNRLLTVDDLEAVGLRGVRALLRCFKNFPEDWAGSPVALCCLANLFVASHVREQLSTKQVIRVVSQTVARAGVQPANHDLQLHAIKCLHHLSLVPRMRRVIQELRADDMVVTAVNAATSAANKWVLVDFGCRLLAQLARHPCNRVEVSDRVLQFVAATSTDEGTPEGVLLVAGEALTWYSKDTDPTVTRLQAMMG